MTENGPKDVKVEMTVQTNGLNEHNVEQKVKFSDDNKGRQNGSPENFVTKVFRNKTVSWSGKAEDGSTDEIKITNITRKKEGGAEIWEKVEPKNNGTVEAKIKDKDVKGTENYDVHFTVNGKSYKVDPKIEMELKTIAPQ